MILAAVIGFLGGFVGGVSATLWLRGRAIDSEVRIAYVLSTAADEMPGFDIIEAAKVGSGSFYPIIAKFERLGMVTSRWEDDQPEGRRRRLYRWVGGAVS